MFSGRVAGESARFLMKSSLCSDEICVADEIQTIVWMKSNPPIRRRGAFHPRRGFHRRRRFHPPVRVDLVEKSTSCEVLFSWQGQKDSIPPRSRTARPDVLLRSTTRAELPTYRNQNKKPPKATFLFCVTTTKNIRTVLCYKNSPAFFVREYTYPLVLTGVDSNRYLPGCQHHACKRIYVFMLFNLSVHP